MQRDWTDPRDGRIWLVTLTPIGGAATVPDRLLPGRYTVAFHRPGELPVWTAVEPAETLEGMGDQRLMDLLDAALGGASPTTPSRRTRDRASARD